jgi:hypothetical protein
MGGDDSQKLLPWRGIYSPPGANLRLNYEINNVTENALGISRPHHPKQVLQGLSYRPPGSFLESTGGSVLARAEALPCGKSFRAHRESHSGIARKPLAFPPESLFAFSPESCSPSPRSAFHDHPGTAFAFPRNPHAVQ